MGRMRASLSLGCRDLRGREAAKWGMCRACSWGVEAELVSGMPGCSLWEGHRDKVRDSGETCTSRPFHHCSDAFLWGRDITIKDSDETPTVCPLRTAVTSILS